MSGLRVACVCGQSGAVSGLAPVLQKGRRGGWHIRVLSYGEAIAAFRHENISVELCEQSFSENDAILWLKEAAPEVVLLGTDAARHVEKRVVRAAKALGIPSVMYVDFWSNYSSRFEDDKGRTVPDVVAVLDAEMETRLQTCGIDRGKLHITGSPALEKASLIADIDPTKVCSLRIAAGLPKECVCVLFVSSPSYINYVSGSVSEDRHNSVLNPIMELASALDSCKELWNRKVYLVVRPHPREDVSAFNEIRFGNIRILVEKEGTGLDWIAHSDLVVGLDTMLLVEAMMARRPVLCLAYSRPLIPAVSNIAKSMGVLVCEKENLLSAMSQMFSADSTGLVDNTSIQQILFSGATQRMIALVTEITERYKQRK